MAMHDITIRDARAADTLELERLAQLDSARVPAGDVLVAEVSGKIVAAASDRGVIADPFRLTSDVVDLLQLRSKALRSPRGSARRPVRARLRLA
jgi:hypothetical protein